MQNTARIHTFLLGLSTAQPSRGCGAHKRRRLQGTQRVQNTQSQQTACNNKSQHRGLDTRCSQTAAAALLLQVTAPWPATGSQARMRSVHTRCVDACQCFTPAGQQAIRLHPHAQHTTQNSNLLLFSIACPSCCRARDQVITPHCRRWKCTWLQRPPDGSSQRLTQERPQPAALPKTAAACVGTPFHATRSMPLFQQASTHKHTHPDQKT